MLKPDDISAVFEWVELLLIKSLKRNLASHKQEEEKEGFNWTSWQAEKLRNVDSFRRQTRSIMSQYTDIIDSETRQLLEEQFEEGVNGADVPPADNIPDTPAEVTPEPHFFGVDRTKVNKLIEDVSYLEKSAETAALRLTDDVYRQTVNRVQLAMSTGSISYAQAVDMAVTDFLAQGINCIEYRDGRRVNIADYVRMVLRTTSTRAALQGKSAKFKAQGYDTVLVSSYGMCSKTCLPWQGRAYIEDTFSYWDGEVEERNGILWGKSQYCGKWFPLLSSAIEKGLFHPNCRHSINLYIEGVTDLPEPMDNSDIERRYKLEQRQRALEREVRKAKRKVEGFTDAENIKKAKAELREAQKRVREYIAKVNADEGARVLARNPLQEKIYSGDVRIGSGAEPVNVHDSSIDKSGGSGIIKNIELPPETGEIRSMSEETKQQISDAIDQIQSEYNVEIDEFVTENLKEEDKNVPFQFQPHEDEDGKLIKRLVINSRYDFMGSQEEFQRRIMRNFNKKTLASNSVLGLISHELAHIMTFQDVITFSGYLLEQKNVAEDMVYGISFYADAKNDGAECIAEAFAAKMCGLPISSEAQALLDKYIEKRRKV